MPIAWGKLVALGMAVGPVPVAAAPIYRRYEPASIRFMP